MICVVHPGSGSRGQKGTGSQIRIHNIGSTDVIVLTVSLLCL